MKKISNLYTYLIALNKGFENHYQQNAT